MGPRWPGWRSLLFVPADARRLIEKAGSRGADAIILDLEDAVAADNRPVARAGLGEMLTLLTAQNATTIVRVNADYRSQVRDLEACVREGISAILLPKAEHPERVCVTSEMITELEASNGLTVGGIGLIPMIESARALFAVEALAKADERVIGLALGSEDLSLDLAGRPTRDVLIEPCRRIAWACRASGRTGVGFPGSIANFSDLDDLGEAMRIGRDLGLGAALCVHPKQIPIANHAYGVSAEELDWARRVDAAFREAEARGEAVCSVDDAMIDRPVALRARESLRKAGE
jgi:citrate lyase subunit beta/citryl-CoA lyase